MAHLGGAVDSEACDAGCGGRAYEGGGDGRDVGVLQVAVRVEEPHGGGGARRVSRPDVDGSCHTLEA